MRIVSWKHWAELAGNAIAYAFQGAIDSLDTRSGAMGIDAFGASTDFTAKKKMPSEKSNL